MICHRLDPNDAEVQEVLRHGPLRYEEVGDESDQDTNAAVTDEGGEPSSADDLKMTCCTNTTSMTGCATLGT